MRKVIVILIVLFCAAGAGVLYFLSYGENPGDVLDLEPAVLNAPPEVVPETKTPSAVLSSGAPGQADVVVIKVQSENKPKAVFQNKDIGFFEAEESLWLGLFGIDAKAAPGTKIISLDLGDGLKQETEIVIGKQDWPVTEIKINEELAEQGYTPQNIAQNLVDENALVSKAMSVYVPSPYFSGKFVDPLAKRVVAGAFGNIRKSGASEIQHLGTDLESRLGEEVYAINDGKVVFAKGGLPNYGTTAIIDHGLGIFSLYLHLSALKVGLGASVGKGEVIGLVGNTGYSLEPHLHFSVRIREARVDPLKFIDVFNGAF